MLMSIQKLGRRSEMHNKCIKLGHNFGLKFGLIASAHHHRQFWKSPPGRQMRHLGQGHTAGQVQMKTKLTRLSVGMKQLRGRRPKGHIGHGAGGIDASCGDQFKNPSRDGG